MGRFLQALAGAALLLLLPLTALGEEGGAASPDPLSDPKAAIARSQAAIGGALGERSFLDVDGREVRLSDYRGRPLVVSLVFTACSQSCPLIVRSLAEAVEVAQAGLGADSFAVVTVGFDSAADSPARMRAFARGQGIDLPNWRFLSGDPTNVDGLVEDLGFLRVASPRGFDHIAQVSLVDPEGRVFAQVYGSSFEAPALVEPLKQLLLDQPGGLFDLAAAVERVRLFCTFFDARSGRYIFDYSFLISVAVGGLALLGLAVVLIRAYLTARRPPGRPA